MSGDIDRLYEVADDHEADVLDRLRNKAGLTWECYGTDSFPCRWTNATSEGDTCGRCGRSKSEVKVKDGG